MNIYMEQMENQHSHGNWTEKYATIKILPHVPIIIANLLICFLPGYLLNL